MERGDERHNRGSNEDDGVNDNNSSMGTWVTEPKGKNLDKQQWSRGGYCV